VVAAFVLLCPLVIKILTAGKYMDAVPYARISAFVSLTSSIYYLINDYSIAKGRPQLYLITTIIGVVAIVALMPVFVQHYSYAGGAMMNVLSFVLLFIINWALLIFTGGKKK
jgi:O-antigen/teichoic acid export membrane protein